MEPIMSSRRGRNIRRGVVAATTALALGIIGLLPGAVAAHASGVRTVPPPKMFGYTGGPAERDGTAAHRPHYVPASATRTHLRIPGHRAPRPDLAPPAMAPRKLVHVAATRTAPGHLVTHRGARRVTSQGTRLGTAAAAAVTDNASYSVAATYDTSPMANQTGRVAVTLTNTGTSTWSGGYGLGTEVFPASDTTGTGTPLTKGQDVVFNTTVAPGKSVTVESVTPNENPGSYTICWDMETPSGVYFSAEGGSEDCAAYTIQQFAAQVNEQSPLPGTSVNTQTPQLSASATVTGGYPAKPVFWFAFQLVTPNGAGGWTVQQSSGWVAGNGNTWTVPKPLTWGATEYWQVAVSDASSPPSVTSTSVTWTTPITFLVGSAQPTVFDRLGGVPQADDGNPVMTSDLGMAGYSGSGKTVDPKTANVSQQVTDASVATAGPALSVLRTYNSLDPRTSQAFGAGWSSTTDMSLVPDPDGTGALILTLADGQQVRFAKNASGGYAPPQSMYAVVTAISGGGFSVTDQTDTTYSFGQASGSSWLLSKITDDQGATETFGYTSGALTSITNNVSGRALHLTWSTPTGATYPHVATVSTDPVTAGQPSTALTWTYGYNGDLLTSVCPPGTTTACTTYGYITNGSHAPTAVLNANPSSYFRLDDPASATAAANQIPVNDLTTVNPPAAEMNTTRGVAGPVPGTTATSFNGTSSYIPMDGAWCTTPGQTSSCIPVSGTNRIVTSSTTSLGFGVWFKTSTASGVLLGLTATLPGSCTTGCSASGATPILWITSTGHLAGAGGLTSPAVVDDGKWHQAVLIPGQTLYIDGAKAVTGNGAFATPAGSYVLLGTGIVPSGTTGSWQFFNGSVADFAVYQNQLPGAGTVAAQYAAETQPAAELTSVTSPGGRTELSATYDTVNDRVASLTDAHGGTWNYGGPVTQSLSAGYDNAVLASSPEDFWPLNDTAGPLAHNLVGGAATAASPRPPATYANATLGVAGPTGFADGTAASLSGSGSQLSIPGGYFAGTGGAGESAELWFSATKAGTLLSAASGSGGNPPTLWVNSSGCVEGTVNGVLLSSSAPCVSAIGDGKWHQVVFTLSPVQTSGTTSQQIATLYVDGKVIESSTVTPGTASAAGYTAVIGNGSDGDFAGSIADVSLYAGQLSSTDVTAHYDGLHNQVLVAEPGNPQNPTYLPTPTLNSQTIAVTDPVGKNASYVYASGTLVKLTDVLGGVTWYGYDASARASTVTDPDGYTTYTTHDSYNNVTSTTTCAAINDCQTTYSSYYENLSNPLDPDNNKPTNERDARSSSPSDPTYDMVTAYTASAQIASKTTPPTLACPSGCKTTYTYTAGSESAIGGGTEPKGLLASTTAPGGGVTSYAYDSAGDVAKVTDPIGMVTTYTFDNIGRELSQTQVSDSYPAPGLTTSYVYDSLDRVVKETDPPITDRVTGAVHTEVTTHTYDPDDDVLTTTISDATGSDPSRTTTNTFDAHGDLASVTDPLGYVNTYTYDAFGDRITATNPAGVTIAYAFDAAGLLLTTTLEGYTGNPSAPIAAENLVQDSRAYDPAGNLASDTNVKGTTADYTYYGNGQVASSSVAGPSGSEEVRTYAYDAVGNKVSETDPGGLTINSVYNADNQVVSQTTDPTGVDRTTTAAYDPDGNVVSQALTGGGVTQTQTMTYNVMDQQLSQTTDNTGGNLTTTYTRDQRGLVVSETDPAGNTTTYQNDEAGRTVVTTAPAVPSQTGNGAAPVTAHPVTMTGYDTFGDETETSDADGNVTTSVFDKDGREVSSTDPSYTPPGSKTPVNGTTTTSYNNLSEVTSETDPLGNTTTMAYDQLGDETSETDPAGGQTIYTYDPAGEQTSMTDSTGAQTQSTYDNLDRLATTTDLVRQNTSAAYTTSYGYDDAGNRVSQTSPTGVVTRAGYDAVGEKTSSTDGAGNATAYSYNLDGSVIKTTLPDGTATTATYDLAGRETGQSDLNASGSALRSESATYTADGQTATSTDFRGDTSTFSYDATGMLTSQTQPVSAGQAITVSYGYDLAGNRTALTDGNGNTTYTTYNSRGLAETITEPATAAHGSTADSQTIDIYDAGGNLVTQNLPGGVQLNYTFNTNGDLTGQTGAGATAPTANRTFTYDSAGRMLTAAASTEGTQGSPGYQPATSETFQYDDRGLLLSTSGSAGTTVFTYNASGQLASSADAAGTSSYTYDSAGRLATDADAASGATGTYSYNSLDQVTQLSYGSGKDSQSFGYDSLHRLTSDTLAAGSGAQVASIGYGYDANDNVNSVTTSGLSTSGGTTGTVTNTYGYDQANRLTSWTATPSGGTATTQTFGYDNAGNLTNDNGVTYTYDARDELVSDSKGNTYTYSADGDQASQNGNSVTFDAYGQQITAGSSSYSWDALNRMVGVAEPGASVALTYEGMSKEVASDSSATYSRDPAGDIIGVNSAVGGKTIALNDQHSDLSGLFTASGAAMTGSTTYSPWGQVLGTSGPSVQVGYQGGWTDPLTGQISMGARFYRPQTGGFVSKDTYTGAEGGAAAVSDNLYAYGDDNPVTVTDPSGHAPSGGIGSGSITWSEVGAAFARAAGARANAWKAQAEAAAARATASFLAGLAHDAQRTAAELNSAAEAANVKAARAAALAAAKFAQAAAKRREAQSWQDKADAALASARQHAGGILGGLFSSNPLSGLANAGDALGQSGVAGYYETRAAGAWTAAGLLWAAAETLQGISDLAQQGAKFIAGLARGAAKAAATLTRTADGAARTARAMTAQAAAASAAANRAQAEASSLASAYYAQVARQLAALRAAAMRTIKKTAARIGSALKTAGKAIGKAAVIAGKAAYKYSGAQSVVSCVTNPTLSSCVQAGIAVAMVVATVATGGGAAAAEVAVDVAADAAEAGVADVAEAGATDAVEAGASAATDEGGSVAEDAAASCGGMSFTAGTRVLLASGKTEAISKLRTGQKVLATDTKTGKNHAGTIAAVLVHYDKDLYDLKVRSAGRTAVIDTTSSHLFWVPGTGGHGRWIKAAALRHGTHLRTPGGSTATVVGGWIPQQRDGWMWDLTIPGDHDFYVEAVQRSGDSMYRAAEPVALLVHNCPPQGGPPRANGRVLQPGQANDLAKWLGYNPTRTISAGSTRIWEAGRGVQGPQFIAEDIRGDIGGIFKGAARARDLFSTGNVLRQGTYDIGNVGKGMFGLVRIGD
jgi:RHS repeat-associated protein